MNNLKQKARSTKQFVKQHRVGIAVVATSIFWIKAMSNVAAQHNEFLEEKGLKEEFYATNEE